METIRNYLESMFKNLPQTEAILKAKYELGQMMEDKYTELIREGKSENEAVGTVIAEFGNLEELAADLGIDDIFKTNQKININRRKLTMDEITGYLKACKNRGLFLASGIACCISCVTGPIISNAFNFSEKIGVGLMFFLIAVGVSLFILAKNATEDYKFINNEACAIDPVNLDFIKSKKRDFTSTYSIKTSVGILLCVTCVMPAIIFGDSSYSILEILSGAFLFYFVSAGVFLLVTAKKEKHAYEKLIGLNTESFFWEGVSESSTYTTQEEPVTYATPTQKAIIECFWPTITCIYLCVSFITFKWYITWIIWPIAGVLFPLLKIILTSKKGKEND